MPEQRHSIKHWIRQGHRALDRDKGLETRWRERERRFTPMTPAAYREGPLRAGLSSILDGLRRVPVVRDLAQSQLSLELHRKPLTLLQEFGVQKWIDEVSAAERAVEHAEQTFLPLRMVDHQIPPCDPKSQAVASVPARSRDSNLAERALGGVLKMRDGPEGPSLRQREMSRRWQAVIQSWAAAPQSGLDFSLSECCRLERPNGLPSKGGVCKPCQTGDALPHRPRPRCFGTRRAVRTRPIQPLARRRACCVARFWAGLCVSARGVRIASWPACHHVGHARVIVAR
jgi:hypothetical protein